MADGDGIHSRGPRSSGDPLDGLVADVATLCEALRLRAVGDAGARQDVDVRVAVRALGNAGAMDLRAFRARRTARLPAEADLRRAVAVTSTLARYSTPLAAAYMVSGVVAGTCVAVLGSARQRRELLPRIGSGTLLSAFAMTEPEAGSDASWSGARAPRKPAPPIPRLKQPMEHSMTHSLSADDEGFREAFEAGRVAPDAFDHRAHVRLAYVYLARNGPEAATAMMREALIGFVRHHGIAASKYHETLTRSWILAVRHFMEHSMLAAAADAFIDTNPTLLDPKIMLTHYSATLLFSQEARAGYVPPDLEPIPTPEG